MDGPAHPQIDTPDLNFVLEAGDEGFVARIRTLLAFLSLAG